jgi:phosphate transport system substrate-binding protein
MSADLDYVPMPDAVKAQVRKVWTGIKDGSGKAIAVN